MEDDKWLKTVNKKGFRYTVRDEVEEIIKDNNIDRTLFHEYSKSGYAAIIRKFYFTFSDIKNFSVASSFDSLHFRSDLKYEYIDCFFRTYDWSEYMKTIKEAVPDKERKMFLILREGWVYEGKINEIFTVLNDYASINDFYIVSSKFGWFIKADDMEDYACIYKI